MPKPHISMIFIIPPGCARGEWMWQCVGNGRIAEGHTPRHAWMLWSEWTGSGFSARRSGL